MSNGKSAKRTQSKPKSEVKEDLFIEQAAGVIPSDSTSEPITDMSPAAEGIYGFAYYTSGMEGGINRGEDYREYLPKFKELLKDYTDGDVVPEKVVQELADNGYETLAKAIDRLQGFETEDDKIDSETMGLLEQGYAVLNNGEHNLGRSLSIGDVLILEGNAYYVDEIGFSKAWWFPKEELESAEGEMKVYHLEDFTMYRPPREIGDGWMCPPDGHFESHPPMDGYKYKGSLQLNLNKTVGEPKMASAQASMNPPSWWSDRLERELQKDVGNRKVKWTEGNENGTVPFDPATKYHNVGIYVDDNPDSPWNGSISIDHFNSGSWVSLDNGKRQLHCPFAKDKDRTLDEIEVMHNVASWRVEFAGDKAQAQRIWDNRDVISKVVMNHGGKARVAVKIEGDDVVVTDYDGHKWSETTKFHK